MAWGRSAGKSLAIPKGFIDDMQRAVVDERVNVLLAGDDPALLDHCGRALVERLRDGTGFQVSVVFDMSRELIVDRFNALVAEMPIEVARSAPDPDAPLRVWMLQVQSAESIAQAKLLLRLTHDFPGAALRLVVLAATAAVGTVSSGLGRKQLAVWRLPTRQTDSGKAPAAKTGPARAGPASGGASGSGGAAGSRDGDRGSGRRGGTGLRLLSLVIVTVLIGVGAALAWMYLDEQRRAAQASRTTPQTQAAEAAADEDGERDQPDGRADGERAGAATGAQLIPGAQPVPGADGRGSPAAAGQGDASGTARVGEAVSASEGAISRPAPERAGAGQPTAGAGARSPEAGAPGEPASDVRRWVAELPADSWVIQHVLLLNAAAVERWQSEHPGLSKARIVPVRLPQSRELRFSLISGPFSQRSDAKAFLALDTVPDDGWIHASAILQANVSR